jgi:hypothetical protein
MQYNRADSNFIVLFCFYPIKLMLSAPSIYPALLPSTSYYPPSNKLLSPLDAMQHETQYNAIEQTQAP